MNNQKRMSARQVMKRLIEEDGWKGFYRGLGPRFFSMSAWGTSMIVSYEYLSNSPTPPPHQPKKKKKRKSTVSTLINK